MKCVLLFCLTIFVLSLHINCIEAQGTCGGDCTSSFKCAQDAGDSNCRCIFLKCGWTPNCGGGCIMDSQCSEWSGDSNCVCSAFECILKKNLEKPGYNPLLRWAEMAKRRKEGLSVLASS